VGAVVMGGSIEGRHVWLHPREGHTLDSRGEGFDSKDEASDTASFT